jgi:hypothetical protein
MAGGCDAARWVGVIVLFWPSLGWGSSSCLLGWLGAAREGLSDGGMAFDDCVCAGLEEVSGESGWGCEPEAGFGGMPRAVAKACDSNDGPLCLWVPFGPGLGLEQGPAIGRAARDFISSVGTTGAGCSEVVVLGWAAGG